MDTGSREKKSYRDRLDVSQFVANNVDAMLAYWDKDQICRFANDAYKKWFGKEREEMVDKMTLSELTGPLYKKNLPYIEAVLKGVHQQFERDIQIPSGEVRHAIANYYPDIINGEVVGFYVHVADVTELKKAEESLLKYRELEAKNKEMEQFVYVASHDLREPLLTMASFAELLKTKYEGKLDSDADQYLNYMLQSANRMVELVKGLLDYSRIGKERKLLSVDCNEIIDTVINDLNTKIKEANATIEIGKLPVLNGYKAELQVLIQNLVSNALKFRKEGVPCTIRVSAKMKNGKWLFKVADNGIGIEDKDKEKIFIIFKRLHNRSEIDGDGIGLAHCKKIVDLHDGNIWVESELGHGSTFYFTLNP